MPCCEIFTDAYNIDALQHLASVKDEVQSEFLLVSLPATIQCVTTCTIILESYRKRAAPVVAEPMVDTNTLDEPIGISNINMHFVIF